MKTYRSQEHAGRNEPCPCGSKKKYKYCHGAKSTAMSPWQRALLAIVAAIVVGGLAVAFMTREDRARPTGVWSAEHGHYH